jgi:hypothetical protein
MLVMALLAAGSIALIIACLRLGRIGLFSRQKAPVVFWTGIGLLGLAAGLCLISLFIEVTGT